MLSLLLAGLLTLGTFFGCANIKNDTTDTTGETEPAVTEPETDPVAERLEALRETVDWGGEDFGILYVNDIAGYTEEVEISTDEKSTVVSEAVHQRNTLFEEYGNLEFTLVPTSNGSVTTKLQGEVQTATGDFFLVTQTTSGTAAAATSNLLYDYLALDIDYDQDWWDEGTLDFALDGKVFFMNGPFNIVDDDVTFVMIFNKTLRENYGVENPYQLVKDGKWTLDKFNSIISKLATENGDGTWNEEDTYGFTAPESIGNTFFYSAGLQYVNNSRDMDAPELVLTGAKLEQALDVLAIARSIVHDNHSSYIAAPGSEALAKGVFTGGRSLFYCEAASYLRALNQEMEAVYGIIPLPKYNEQQENYTTWSHSIGSTLSIPTSVGNGKQDMEQFAAVLELYTILSEQHVRPAYYDNMLTTRNVHDAESAEMMDLIFLHRTYDMAMYFDSLGMASIFSTSVSGADQFSSSYNKVSSSFDKAIRNILRRLQNPRK